MSINSTQNEPSQVFADLAYQVTRGNFYHALASEADNNDKPVILDAAIELRSLIETRLHDTAGIVLPD